MQSTKLMVLRDLVMVGAGFVQQFSSAARKSKAGGEVKENEVGQLLGNSHRGKFEFRL